MGKSQNTATNDELWEGLDLLPLMGKGVKELYGEHAPGATVPPLIMSEFNMAQVLASGCGALLQFINTLWHVELIGEVIKGGDFTALNSFSWADATYNCSNSGRGSRGDYGMVSHGSHDKPDGTPQAQFYSYSLFQLAFGETMVNCSTISHGIGIKTYASTFSGGEIGLIVVNENAADRTIKVEGVNSRKAVTSNGWLLQSSKQNAPDPLSSRGLLWNGVYPLNFPLDSNYDPYVLSADVGETIEFDVPAYAAAGIVFYYADDDDDDA
eukprot:FR737275.1.p1 GENE.FR737275.1~~FR737275.1.p1  ORF type:complete len:290 (+),score=23.35 FR737275.1:69-872(+)